VGSHRNVTVRNGTVRNFAQGISLFNSQDANLVNLRVLSEPAIRGAGIEIRFTAGVTVQGGTIQTKFREHALIVEASDNLLMSGVSIIGSIPGAATARSRVSLSGKNITIEHSTLVDVDLGHWISVLPLIPASTIVIEYSQLTRTDVSAVKPVNDDFSGEKVTAKMTGNRFSGGGVHISAGSFHGPYPPLYDGPIFSLPFDDPAEFVGVEITGNTFDGADSAGVFIQIPAEVAVTDMVISGNTFIDNGHRPVWGRDLNGSLVNDGLHIAVARGADVTVSGNRTSGSADYGIEAAPGTVIDGGGNTSSNDPNGCLGVACA
jgi:hypothetical protein